MPTETEPLRQNASLRPLRDVGENTPLTSNLYEEETDPPLLASGYCMKVKAKFRSRHFWLCSSKAALIILVWNLIIAFGLVGLMDPTIYTFVYINMYDVGTISLIIRSTLYGFNAFVFLFYPLAGYLADIRWGRHKTVVNSLCFIMWTLILLTVLGGLIVIGISPVIGTWPSSLEPHQTTASVVLFVVLGLPAVFGVILLFCSLVAFNANVIQYGMDQLHDAPTDHSVLYIYWYVWTIYAGSLIVRLPFVFSVRSSFVFVPGLAPVLLGITLCIQKYNRRSFLIDSGSRNPYKLVYQIFKFAKDHTNPIRRSAFTYCEDELPSRLDLGKEKYGGPFKNEDVENVKAFVGIVCVLLSTGPTFIADIAIHAILPSIAEYDYDTDYNEYSGNGGYEYDTPLFYSSGCLTPLIIVVLIPLYLFLLRPFIHDYIPGMLKRMGIGMIMFFLSGLCTLLMGAFRHETDEVNILIIDFLNINVHFLIIQSFLNAVGLILLNVATFEFICAQSPHSMKGFLIGTFFTIKGIFQLIGVLAVLTPVTALCKSHAICGFIYYFLNIVILFIGIIAFTIVARRYQYRVRDEPDNIYRYAEEYYANAQDEPNYDYDDYDNLNVETIRN